MSINIKDFALKDSKEQWEAIKELQKEINEINKEIKEINKEITTAKNKVNIYETIVMKEMDKYKYRLSQKTTLGTIDHYFHEDREEQLIKLIRYCNENNIEYELNEKAKEFHNKLYNMILKGE